MRYVIIVIIIMWKFFDTTTKLYTIRPAGLVLKWVTVFQKYRLAFLIKTFNRPTQSGHPFVGKRNEYRVMIVTVSFVTRTAGILN